MDANEYQELAYRTAPLNEDILRGRLASYPNLIHAAFGINTESGELTDTLKKTIIYGKELDVVNIKEECGDLLWYIALALSVLGYTLEDVMEENIEKLRIRYPEKFTESDAIERKDKC